MSLDKIKNILGAKGFLEKAEDKLPFEKSWRGGYQGKAALIALPSSVDQVSKVVEICVEAKIPIVPQGGNTGLVSGGVPDNSGKEIVISLSRLNKIRAIDKDNFTMVAEAGCILQTLQEKAKENNRLFPMSIASEGSAMLGGLISTNAGGTAVIRYGNMRDLVFGLEVVLPSGDIWNGLTTLRKDNTGYDLKQLFIGAEGTLGIITAASVKLFPVPKNKITLFIGVENIDDAAKLFGIFRMEFGDNLTAFEMVSGHGMELAIKNIPDIRNPLSSIYPYSLLIEISSWAEEETEKSRVENFLASLMEKGVVKDAALAGSIAQERQFWHIREHIPEAIKKAGKGLHFDISMPISSIPGFIKGTDKAILDSNYGIKLAPFGHMGDGNLHYNMYISQAVDDTAFQKTKNEIKTIVYDRIAGCSGSISAEHGIGLERKEELKKYTPGVELKMMKNIKKALDPDNLMNPGRIFD